jgi:ubiquinone/menaquinone biosynthesis C-methylase UbiE
MNSHASYFTSRFTYDARRDQVWQAIVDDLGRRQLLAPDDMVVELGAGYCHCINNIVARRRIAIDVSPEVQKYAGPGVETSVQACFERLPIDDNSADVIVASNLFEHLERRELSQTAAEIRRVLRSGGRLVVIQPNYRYCSREYFDDYTHVLAFSHHSLRDFFVSEGLRPIMELPRYLPFSMRTRVPKGRRLVSWYLRLPVRPFAKQMLIAWEKP